MKIILRYILLLAIISTSANVAAFSKGDRILEPGSGSAWLFGPFGGITYNMHNGNFTTTDGRFICCEFDKGSGVSYVFGLKAFIPLSESIELSPRIQLEGRGGEFTKLQKSLPILGKNNKVELMDIEDKLDVTLTTGTIDILADYKIPFHGMYIALGPSFGFLLSKHFKKNETIVAPPGVTYLDGTTSKQVFDGEMDIVNSFFFALRGGVGANFQISESIYLNPEILYSYQFNKVSKNEDWKASSLLITLGILFSI